MTIKRMIGLAALITVAACGVESPAGPQPNGTSVDAAMLNAGRQPISDEPSFTPFDVAPRIMNRDEVRAVLEQEYPALLREAGVGGRTIVWLQLDEAGMVRLTTINQSSGQAPLDQAALRVAEAMKFTPAELKGAPTAVWVSIPIQFRPEGTR
jgi:TonB family protein